MIDALIEKIKATDNPSVVGIDTDISYLPQKMAEHANTPEDAAKYILDFNCRIIDKIYKIVPAIKVQVAYYEMLGVEGFATFSETIKYARKRGMLAIADVKRNDIGATATAYSKAYFSGVKMTKSFPAPFDSDFITVNGYLGIDGILPFINDCKAFNRGIFVLVKTSNPSSSQLQDLKLQDGRTVFEAVAGLVNEWGRGSIGKYGYNDVGAVVGATHPQEAGILRKLMPNTFFLVPGYGAQGGTANDLRPCFDSKGGGAIVNSSRAIICAYKSEKYKGLEFDEAAYRASIDMQSDINKVIR